MKKLELQIPKNEEVTRIIENALYKIFTAYNCQKYSDLHYIKINIVSNISIIIKMLMPFENTSSYIIYAYLNSGKDQQMIFSIAIQETSVKNQQLALMCHSIGVVAENTIFQYNKEIDINSITVVHNLDSKDPSVIFEELKINNSNTITDITEFIYWMGQELNSRCSCAYVKLIFHIHPDEPEEVKSTFEILIEHSTIFQKDVYSYSLRYPGQKPYYEIGLDFADFADLIYDEIASLYKIATYACLPGETGTIKYFKMKQEVS